MLLGPPRGAPREREEPRARRLSLRRWPAAPGRRPALARGKEKAAGPWSGPRLRLLSWRRYRRET